MEIYDLCGNDGLASGIYRLGFIGWDLSVGIYRLEFIGWNLSVGIYRLEFIGVARREAV
nr:hypothetical protein [uncultured Campylobacter sp.]